MGFLVGRLRNAAEVFTDPKVENNVSDDKGVNANENVTRKVESIFKKPHRAVGMLTLSERKSVAGGTVDKKEVCDGSNQVKAPEQMEATKW